MSVDTSVKRGRIVPLYSGMRKHSVAHLLGMLTLTIIGMPLLEDTTFERGAEVTLFTITLIFAVFAVGGRRRSLVAALCLVLPALLTRWMHELVPQAMPREIFTVCGFLFVAFVIGHLLRYILVAPRVNSEVICAGIAIYLLMAMLWSFAYATIYRHVPNSFNMSMAADAGKPLQGFRSLYFSFTTMSTGGYGDIIPTAGTARMLAMLQQTTGMFYMAVLISRLVSLYSSQKPSTSSGNPS